jgi:thiamine biosynthesis lipoprotein
MPAQPNHNFTHEAMKTTFQLRLRADDAALAQSVARACFERLDRIEASLSRYVPGSDVWQINHLKTGESRFVSEDCEQCLRLAMVAGQASGGLFDVTLGRLIEHRKSGAESAPPALQGQLIVDESRPRVFCVEAGREIDLGGIGKGYALDAMAALCREWGMRHGLLSAGASTQLAFGKHAWPITLRGDTHSRVVNLKNSALSASGTVIQGSHIVAPAAEAIAECHSRAWVQAESAAIADALSTAAIIARDFSALHLNQPDRKVFIENAEGISARTPNAP